MYRLGGDSSRAHRLNDRRGAGYGISACKHAGPAGCHVFVSHDAAVFVGFKALCRRLDQRIGGCADCDDRGVTVDPEQGSRFFYCTPPSLGIRLAQFHLDTVDT